MGLDPKLSAGVLRAIHHRPTADIPSVHLHEEPQELRPPTGGLDRLKRHGAFSRRRAKRIQPSNRFIIGPKR